MASCTPKSSIVSNANFDTAVLYQTWMRSNEEGKDNLIVYRPSSYAFPPSRGREKLVIRKNGTLSNHVVAPACGFQEKKGDWKIVQGNMIEVKYKDQILLEKYEVMEAKTAVLKLKPTKIE